MRKKNAEDVFDVFSHLKKYVLDKKPTSKNMWKEIQMMRFKVRPLYGDISFLNTTNTKLVEIVWRLGKLDSFFQEKYDRLDEKQRSIFFRMIDTLHEQLQAELNKIELKKDPNTPTLPSLEMEIFKEGITKNQVN